CVCAACVLRACECLARVVLFLECRHRRLAARGSACLIFKPLTTTTTTTTSCRSRAQVRSRLLAGLRRHECVNCRGRFGSERAAQGGRGERRPPLLALLCASAAWRESRGATLAASSLRDRANARE